MTRKPITNILIMLLFIAFHSLSVQAGAFRPEAGSTVLADNIVAAIERGDSIIIDSCRIVGPIVKEGTLSTNYTIKNSITISNSSLLDSAIFKFCFFKCEVHLINSTLSEKIRFMGTTFHDYATFNYSTFKKYADFTFSTFEADAEFSVITFESAVSFLGTFFDGNVKFTSTNFNNPAIFMNTVFNKKVTLDPEEFKNIKLLGWRQLKGHLDFTPEANFKLLKYFEERRMLENADEVYLFMKDQERMKEPKFLRYLEYWLFQLPFGYGVKPLNTLYLSIIIVIVFALFYTKPNSIKEIEKEFGHQRRRRLFQNVPKSFWKRFYNALYFSIHTFIIGIVSNWHPTDEFLINTRRITLFKKRIKLFKFRTLSMIEGVLGWILLTVFIVILTRKFIR